MTANQIAIATEPWDKPVLNEVDIPQFAFAEVVALKIDGGWHYVGDGRQADECLRLYFPDIDAPSATRARVACQEFLAGKLAEQAARTTLIVAAMEAGFQFETGEATDLIERHLTEAAEAGIRAVR
jgi:hypothetical protein